MASQPTVMLVFNDKSPSFVAFDERGEVLETVDVDLDGSPIWTDAAICDHRGGGGEEGFQFLVTALRAAEENARLVGYDITRVSA